MEKDLRKRPFDSPWRGSYMDSRNMRGHEAKEKRTENGKVFDLGRGVFQLVQFPAPVPIFYAGFPCINNPKL